MNHSVSSTLTLATGRRNRTPMASLLVANVVSELGNSLSGIAIPWYVLVTTGSAARAGLVGAANMLAMFLAGIFGGVIVDRLGFKRMSVVADLASGASVACVPLLDATIGLHFWQLLTLVFVGAVLDNPGVTARRSIVPDLAKLSGTRLERANSLVQSASSIPMLLGPPLGGVLIVALGPSRVLWLDAASFVFSAVAVSAFVPGRVAKTEVARRAGSWLRAYFNDLDEGLSFVRRHQLVRAMTTMSVITNFATAPLGAVVFPVYGREVYSSATGLGVMLAGWGVGALAGSLIFGAVGHRLPRHAAFTVCFFCMGTPMILLALEPPLAVGATLLAFCGMAFAPLNPISATISQERVPPELRGRVLGLGTALAVAAAPLGMIVVGALVQSLGIISGLIITSVGFFCMTVYLTVNPTFREMNRPPSAMPGPSPA